MTRTRGEPLSPDARVAVISNDALGNYVVVTPLLQMLRNRLPGGQLHYYGGTRTQELWSRDERLDEGFALFGRPLGQSLSERYDLVVNVESLPGAKAAAAVLGEIGTVIGPCLDAESRGDLPYEDGPRGDLWRDPEWVAEDLPCRYPFLGSPFIGEIFCRLAYLDGPVPPYRVPCEPVPAPADVLIAMSASLPDKLWTLAGWRQTLRSLRDQGLTVGLLGAKPKMQAGYWKGVEDENAVVEEGLALDLRGRFTLPQVVGALGAARLVLTLDNGIMHAAAATGTPTVALFRHGIHRLWTPPGGCVRPVVAAPGAPVASVTPQAVEEALGEA